MKNFCVKIPVIIMTFFLVLPLPLSSKEKAREKKQVIDFTGVDVVGKLKKPEGMFIMDRKELKFKRLLNLDESFINNIIKSINEF